MQNESELISALEKINFEIVDPSLLTVMEQIKFFAESSFIISPSGAALFNVVFCKQGTTIIDIESEPNWIYCHTNILASMGLDYHIFEGIVDPNDSKLVHKAWIVDVKKLVKYVVNLFEITQYENRVA